jgi:hypothetical protein
MRWGSLSVLPRRMQSQFEAVGARDVAILDKRSTTVAGRPALAFRIRFSPLDRPDRHAVWLISAVETPRALVLVQTITVARLSDEPAVLAQKRRIQARVVESLELA